MTKIKKITKIQRPEDIVNKIFRIFSWRSKNLIIENNWYSELKKYLSNNLTQKNRGP